jgi:Flp pilus assembly protein CpaB
VEWDDVSNPEVGLVSPRPAANRLLGRRSRRSVALPAGRAVVGGLLVAASAVGLFAAYAGASDGPRGRYVVVRADIPAGEAITASDLDVVSVDLPAAQRRVSFTDVRALVGAVTLTGLRGGQLVQSGDVASVDGAGERAQLSVAVDPGQAMNGDHRFIRPGERVDVIVTTTNGGQSATRTVAVDALVVEVLGGSRGLGGGRLTVVLAVPPADLEPIAGAAASGTVTLARTTGLHRSPES